MIWDTFPMHDELELLECRLTELQDIPNLRHVVVEAEVTHQDEPKPSYLSDNWERFSPWHDRIVRVWATDLPTLADNPDAWAREHTQREWVRRGLTQASNDDVILHGDLDEIPTAVVARNVNPQGAFWACEQRGHFWSLRWIYPQPWMGTVAARAGRITSFAAMRDVRNQVKRIPNAGWHLSWLPKNGLDLAESAMAKVGSYCHPEVTDRIQDGVSDNRFVREGIHVDGVKMIRCEVDGSFPKWIRDGNAPASWSQ